MKYLLLALIISSPAGACHSLKQQPNSPGLTGKTLCRMVNGKIYDVSFGQKLLMKSVGLKAELRMVNTEFTDLLISGAELRGDFRDLHGSGVISDTSFSDADFRFADLRSYHLSEIKFESTRLEGVNFKGVDLSRVEFIDSDLAGAIFDLRTKLPFSVDEALEKGMVIK